MKLSKLSSALIALTVIVFAVTTLSAQRYPNQKTQDWIQYYWFDECGNYLWRQNTVSEEISLTGYDNYFYAPFTVREQGFTASAVTGNPPVPIFPYPNVRLYSHP